MSDLALVSPSDLSLVDSNSLNPKQLDILLKSTPKKFVHERPAKGGGKWEYVTGGYVRKVLNLMFGWNWSFEVVEKDIIHGEAVVLGKLTCTSNDVTITKMQYGNKDIMYRKSDSKPLSIGNDLKAATTDALKKCAAELGIAADIYNKQDFKEIRVDLSIDENISPEKSRALKMIQSSKSLGELQKWLSDAQKHELTDEFGKRAEQLEMMEEAA